MPLRKRPYNRKTRIHCPDFQSKATHEPMIPMPHAKDSPDLQSRKDAAREQALAWFVRMNSAEATVADRSALSQWLAGDPRNQHEYDTLGRIWSDLDGVRDPRLSMASPHVSAAPSRRMVLSGGIAAAVAGGYLALNGLPDILQSDEYTGIGETRRAELEDGSIVDMDADTAYALEYDDRVRGIHLQRGRALFDVTNDPRPFRVRSSGGVITALGTRFSVHLWDGTTTVAVQDHAVTVEARGASPQRIEQGQRLSFAPLTSGTIEPSDAAVETAWLRGKLIFEDRPLRQVLADVNRYRSGVIHVTSDRLLDMRVSGIFDISNPDGVLQAIEDTLPLRSARVTRYLVVLRPA